MSQQHDNIGSDPYNYADLDIYSFNVNFDRKLGFDVGEPVTLTSAPLTAPHPHMIGMDDGQFWCVATPDAIYGPYLTEAAAQSVIDDGIADAGESEVFPMSHP